MESQLYQDIARLEAHHWWYRGRRAIVREVLRGALPKRRLSILDAGCGTGGMLGMLEEFGEVEGLDSSDEGLAYCRERVGPSVPLHRGALPDGLPKGRSYELITAFDVIEHLDDPVAGLSALRSSLVPNGWLACTVPAYPLLWSEHDEINHHRRRYTRKLLRTHLEAAGFVPGFFSHFNAALFPPIALLRIAQKLARRRSREPGPPRSDFGDTPPLVNALLTRLFSAERFVVPRLSLPFGVSLLALARTG